MVLFRICVNDFSYAPQSCLRNITKTTSVDQKIGEDSDVNLKNVGFCLFFGIYLFDCLICLLGSIYHLGRVLKFLHTKLKLNIFII